MEKKFTKKRSSHVLPVVTSENAELLRKMRSFYAKCGGIGRYGVKIQHLI